VQTNVIFNSIKVSVILISVLAVSDRVSVSTVLCFFSSLVIIRASARVCFGIYAFGKYSLLSELPVLLLLSDERSSLFSLHSGRFELSLLYRPFQGGTFRDELVLLRGFWDWLAVI